MLTQWRAEVISWQTRLQPTSHGLILRPLLDRSSQSSQSPSSAKVDLRQNEKAPHLYRGQTFGLKTRFSQLQELWWNVEPMECKRWISIHRLPPIILITIAVFIIFTMVVVTIGRIGMIMICWHVGLQSPSHGWISRPPILQRDISTSTLPTLSSSVFLSLFRLILQNSASSIYCTIG